MRGVCSKIDVSDFSVSVTNAFVIVRPVEFSASFYVFLVHQLFQESCAVTVL